MWSAAVVAVMLAAWLPGGAADLPVHCVHRDILGTWEFRLGESDGDNTATCGHGVPDRVMTMVERDVSPHKPTFPIKRTLVVELRNPNLVVGPGGRTGTWTTVYDEGMEVEMDGWRYMTFFRYLPRFMGADPNKVEHFRSLCNETVSGWYHPIPTHAPAVAPSWGCFVGVQTARTVAADSPESVAAAARWSHAASGDSILSPDAMPGVARFSGTAELQRARGLDGEETEDGVTWPAARGTTHRTAAFRLAALRDGGTHRGMDVDSMNGVLAPGRMADVPPALRGQPRVVDAAPPALTMMELSASVVSSATAMEALATRAQAAAVVERLNADPNRLWRAVMPDAFIGASRTELLRRAGASSTGKVHRPVSAYRFAGVAHGGHGSTAEGGRSSSSAAPGEHAPVHVDVSALPQTLDWSMVDGGGYIPEVLDQGSCGSCYAAAASDALTSRARIRAKGRLNHLTLSPQSVVQCSSFNQGCDGGYPFLVGKFGVDIGFVPISCMSYTASNAACPGAVECPELTDVLPIWHAIQRGPSSAATSSVGALLEVGSGEEGSEEGGGGRMGLGQGGVFTSQAGEEVFGMVGIGDGMGPDGRHPSHATTGHRGADGVGNALPQFRVSGGGGEGGGGGESALANTYAMGQRLQASRYEYVGGYYGACSEEAMIRELQDGPVAVALNVPGDLFYYGGGIYHHDGRPEPDYDVTPTSRWEKTNHAVLLVGYGEEVVNGQAVKYWKLKNSWGAKWGEPSDPSKVPAGQRGGGYFRMVRGRDMLAVESMAVVIDP